MSFKTCDSGEFFVAYRTSRIFSIVGTFMECKIELNIKWHWTLVTSMRLFKKNENKTIFELLIHTLYKTKITLQIAPKFLFKITTKLHNIFQSKRPFWLALEPAWMCCKSAVRHFCAFMGVGKPRQSCPGQNQPLQYWLQVNLHWNQATSIV